MNSWTDFKSSVDLFLGDSYRERFESAVAQPSSTTGRHPIGKLETDDLSKPENLNLKKQTLENSPQQKIKNKVAATKKNKLKMTPCGWCGKFHFPHQCKDKVHPKWQSYRCKICYGKGHPPSVCPTKLTIAPVLNENFSKKILYVDGPEGMSVLNMFDPDSAAPQGSIVIDTGDAVSVAPKRFENVSSLNVKEKNDYNLVTASGSKIKVFGTQDVKVTASN